MSTGNRRHRESNLNSQPRHVAREAGTLRERRPRTRFTPCPTPLSPFPINDLALRPPASRLAPALPCQCESPSHPPGAKDHVSGILDPSAERNSGEVVAENWNSVPHGRDRKDLGLAK